MACFDQSIWWILFCFSAFDLTLWLFLDTFVDQFNPMVVFFRTFGVFTQRTPPMAKVTVYNEEEIDLNDLFAKLISLCHQTLEKNIPTWYYM